MFNFVEEPIPLPYKLLKW